MPRGRPKKQAGAQGAPNAAQASANGVNRMECVRRALHYLGPDASPKQLRAYIRREFHLRMDQKMLSSYKGSILRKAAGQSGLISRQGNGAATPVRGAGPADGSISLDDLRAIKELAGRLGAEQLRGLAGVLAG
jgi:hypothetical protein